MTLELLRGTVRPYAWGSRTVIAELTGNPSPAPHPEAELWFGAHPASPSTVDGTALTELLELDAHGHLGTEITERWAGRLPFLIKVLAADEPLSLQAHPSAGLAAEGYAREEAAGIPRDAPERNYPDPTAKPELLCALSEFHALAGFREPRRSVELLRALDCEPLRPYTELLAGQPDEDGLRALFTTFVTLPSSALEQLLPAVVDACVRHVRERGEFDLECRTALELAERYPGDAGILAALLLNRLVLQPGEAIHIAAGNLHAYLRGTAIEILAASDNVLRCGLTPKHVDVPELLRVLDFAADEMPVLKGEQHGAVRRYQTSAEEFELSVAELDGAAARAVLTACGPQILLCTEGTALLRAASGHERVLGKGEAVWSPAKDGDISVTPVEEHIRTTVYRASLPSGQ
ncbi:mannose-6-phosphate isomerase, class I [Sciscionella sediminilitoris]|uniref:mannose-6-phosphate isomerase, class I n=1 Tax=Sciscionella sediminilitoris TaxID=1445613 RepID=UPI0004DF86FC|nr:mannose-6-phosphate isomerase, class I [Sciscionella sp. SE31]